METSQKIGAPASTQAAGPERSTLRTRDGVELPLYVWRTKTPPRAALALVHGLAEHAGRHAALAARLNAAAIDVSTQSTCAAMGAPPDAARGSRASTNTSTIRKRSSPMRARNAPRSERHSS
ncbi:hypothetical protein SAMN05421548_1305 [Paraburkholderia lycopersici]|uniref:Uncharacterized protein n=1 Tax=Paraburkholderia lycopersici TaxID=416944 RepID=A0A1G6ZAI3_9BURK|nr:hypothetical protein SAMN05421548_1305 [Paraburkholderia lycopersici]